jgi:hypothetical protein
MASTPAVAGGNSYLLRNPMRRLQGQYTAMPDAARDATIQYGIDAFGFLIHGGERLSFPQFADRIAEHYDITTPRTRTVCEALRSVV